MAGSSQYRHPLDCVHPYDTDPNLDGNAQRKRLVFIRRNFERNDKDGVIIYYAILEAGKYLPDGSRYEWLPWMASYDGHARINVLREECHKLLNKPAKFDNFSVILSSIFFIAGVQGQSSNSVVNYFRFGHHLQPGTHVFLKRTGVLSFINNMIIPFPEQFKSNKNRRYHGTVFPITSIYPAKRHEWQTTGVDNVVYGLNFGDPGQNQTYMSGRYYHRFSDYCLKAYGVNELTKEDILNFKQQIGDKPFTALYVCAGAKLVVIDPYSSETINRGDSNHNRILVQQGGLAIFQGLTNIRIHIHNISPANKATSSKVYTWQNFSQRNIKRVSADYNGPDYASLTQMVVFLGGIDSDRNSIAWELLVSDNNGSKEAYLGIPIHRNRNTPIEAISKGISGLDEIIARMGYEQLHDSVLTEHHTIFEPVQDYRMMRTILNVNGERTLEVTYRTRLKPTEMLALVDKDLPREFNISTPSSKFLEVPDNEFFKSQMNRKTRAAPPPMYPPIKTTAILYWPSSELPIANVEKDCYKYDKSGRLSIKIDHGQSHSVRKYEYSDTENVKAYHYERMTREGDQNYQNHSGVYHNSGGSTYRIGVDGWMWRKLGSEIYNEKNTYLTPDPPGNEPPKRSHHSQGGSTRKKSRR